MINPQADDPAYQSKSLSVIYSIRRSTSSSRVLQLYVFSHLAFSFCVIYLFCRYVRVSRWMVVFHMMIAAGLLAGLVIVTGLLLLSRHLRARRFTRYVIAVIYATWTSALAFLYLSDFITYGLWSADINFHLVSHYIFRRNVMEGDGLGDRNENAYGHGRSLYQEIIHIPLLIYDDPKTVYANLKFATQIDVAPTILARLGLSIPASWQGQSLLNPDGTQFEFHQTNLLDPNYAILFRTQGAVYKYLYRTWDGAGIEELYELTGDPKETHNLFPAADPSLIKQMRAKLEEYLAQS